MNFVLNERECALDALQQCSLGSKPGKTLSRLAKYYRAEGYKKSDIRAKLEDFLVKCDGSVNLVMWQDTIDKIVKSTDKYSLIEVDCVRITEKELAVCGSLSSTQMRRLLFTLICLAKFNLCVNENTNGWISAEDRDIFKLANVCVPLKKQSLMLGELRDMGLIAFGKRVDSMSIRVKCLRPSSSVAMRITDLRNLGYQYLRQCGEPYIECSSCGLVVRRGSNAQKYCKDCAEEANRQHARENWRNIYSLW